MRLTEQKINRHQPLIKYIEMNIYQILSNQSFTFDLLINFFPFKSYDQSLIKF